MTSLMDAIAARRLADALPADQEPLIVDAADWAAWDGSDETCPWKRTGPGLYRHGRTGEVYEWGRPYVLPGDD